MAKKTAGKPTTSPDTSKVTVDAAQSMTAEILESVNKNFTVVIGMLQNQSILLGADPSDFKARERAVPVTMKDLEVEDIDVVSTSSQLSAIGHPIRLEILKLCAYEPRRVRELVDSLGQGTTGQIYHHLRQLVDAGWVKPVGSGSYLVNDARVPALVAIVNATR